jgi:hypothetical protein
MAVGQIQSNSSLVGSLVLSASSLNNTGIANTQVKPLDLAGQSSNGEKSISLAPSIQTYNFIGKLTSQQSAASGGILNAVA